MELFVLRPVTEEDVPQIEKWLYAPHVSPWFEDADDWLTEIRGRAGEFSFLRHFVAVENDTPFAFCQYYDCYDAREDWYAVDAPGQVFSIDYMIGEPAYLGKGYGQALVAALSGMVKARESGAWEIIVQPDEQNAKSIRVLEANGYRYDGGVGYYRKGLR